MEQRHRTRESQDEDIVEMPTTTETDTKVDLSETDKLLDEIDEVLGDTLDMDAAEQFVSDFRQVNGQ